MPALVVEVAKLNRLGVSDGPDFSSEPDTKDSSKTIAGLGLGGLGLPDRDYYLKDDAKTTAIRTAYRGYVATQLQNLGDDAAAAGGEADAILALETALAKVDPDPGRAARPDQDLPPDQALARCRRWRRTFPGARTSRSSARPASTRSTSASRPT